MLSKTKIGADALAKLASLLGHEEGERLTVYQDSGGAWTIGKGHLVKPGERFYPYGTVKTITQAESDALFAADMAEANDIVHDYVNYPLTANMQASLASLAYNIGRGAFSTSTLVKKLNAGDLVGAGDEFSRWIYDNGKIDPVLVGRRAREKSMFMSA